MRQNIECIRVYGGAPRALVSEMKPGQLDDSDHSSFEFYAPFDGEFELKIATNTGLELPFLHFTFRTGQRFAFRVDNSWFEMFDRCERADCEMQYPQRYERTDLLTRKS